MSDARPKYVQLDASVPDVTVEMNRLDGVGYRYLFWIPPSEHNVAIIVMERYTPVKPVAQHNLFPPGFSTLP